MQLAAGLILSPNIATATVPEQRRAVRGHGCLGGKRRRFAFGLQTAGVALALGDRALGGASGTWLGEAAVFLSAAAGAICSALYRPYLQEYSALVVGAFAMLASLAFLAVLAAAEGFFHTPLRITPAG